MFKRTVLATAVATSLAVVSLAANAEQPKSISLAPLGTFETGVFEAREEIVAGKVHGNEGHTVTIDTRLVEGALLEMLRRGPVHLEHVDGPAAQPAVGARIETGPQHHELLRLGGVTPDEVIKEIDELLKHKQDEITQV